MTLLLKVSSILTQSDGAGNAGPLVIETGRLIVSGGAIVSTTSTNSGDGGTLSVTASDSIQLTGGFTSVNNSSPSGLFALATGSGRPGDLSITTKQLIIRDGARATASNFGSSELGGTLSVNATDLVQLIGTSPDSQVSSGLLVGTEGTGNAGKLTIETQKLQVSNGAIISARTNGEGNGGSITIKASDSVELNGIAPDGQKPTVLTTETRGVKDAGNLTIETGLLTVKNGAQITSSSTGGGSAGNIQVITDSLRLDHGNIVAQTESGNGGNITLSVKDLLVLRHQGQISATAGTDSASGNGGNITINAPNGFIVSVPNENSDITANAFEGSGGNITITSSGNFNIQQRDREELERELQTNDPTQLNTQRLPTNDITAFSQTDPTLEGQINISTLDVDQKLSLVKLPTVLIDTLNIVDTGCNAIASTANAEGSKFIVTGRGGLPPSPDQPLTTDVLWSDTRLAFVTPQQQGLKKTVHRLQSKSDIIEINPATGWVFDNQGNVTLISHAPNTHGVNSLGKIPASCSQR
ncbi:MAG: S-layer family protein [Scytonema sp. PMC 1069.18]|nr:S-layer family protein [Scytonema sp. PMC 1069.18]MEC4885459.1 S-layer family protein [Scytonema sp. PMC 1070.18]